MSQTPGLRVIVFCSAIVALASAACTVPPDFWCDHPKIALQCTGSLRYCDAYKTNRQGKKLSLQLAFESACPDSQSFVTQRLYPQLLSKPALMAGVDFEAYPWGLAKREFDSKVKCHHGPRECLGNALLTCAMHSAGLDSRQSAKLLSCFMSSMLYLAPPLKGMQECFKRLDVPFSRVEACMSSPKADDLQKQDETATSRILSTPRFVPHISINGRSHLHMQAYQMFIGEKVRMWQDSLAKIPVTTVVPNRCQVPPDFWCSDPGLTAECFTPSGCATYSQLTHGKPLRFRVIYDSSLKASVDYVTGYLWQYVHNLSSGKAVIDIEPTPKSFCHGDGDCTDHAIQECVASKVHDPAERTKLLYCLLRNRNATAGSMEAAWEDRCHFLTTSHAPGFKNDVLSCAKSLEWRTLSAARATEYQTKLQPEPKRSDPWLIINDASLETAQAYQRLLYRFVCLWYRGPGHDRDACFRCEYEATHC